MSVDNSGIVLDRFMPIEEFCEDDRLVELLANGKMSEMFVPRSCVVEKPEWVSPLMARRFHTSLYYLNGVVMGHAMMMAREKTPRGVSSVDAFVTREIVLFEYWENEGSDDWPKYKHTGYVFCLSIRGECGRYPAEQIKSRVRARARMDRAVIGPLTTGVITDGKQI